MTDRPRNAGRDPIYDVERLASATECTGLTPSAVLSEAEAESYAELYAIHRQRVDTVPHEDDETE